MPRARSGGFIRTLPLRVRYRARAFDSSERRAQHMRSSHARQPRQRLAIFSGAITVVATVACATASAAYPERPIRLIVGAPPGSGSELSVRIVAQKLSE